MSKDESHDKTPQQSNAPSRADQTARISEEEEAAGLSILGASSVRGGAIGGVSDPVRDGRAGPHERADDIGQVEERTNPPDTPEAGSGDGGLDASGGRAGGAGGDSGRPLPESGGRSERGRGRSR